MLGTGLAREKNAAPRPTKPARASSRHQGARAPSSHGTAVTLRAARCYADRVTAIVSKLTSNYEVIFAVDPSPDRTAQVVEEAFAQDHRINGPLDGDDHDAGIEVAELTGRLRLANVVCVETEDGVHLCEEQSPISPVARQVAEHLDQGSQMVGKIHQE